MNVYGYNMNSYMSNNLFNTTSSKTNSITSLFTNASYYNTLTKYAITNKYRNNNVASAKDTISGTQFLTNYDKTYSDLAKASSNLKSLLKDDSAAPDTNAIIDATQKYVDAYNSTNQFLEEHTGLNTSRLNLAKNSLSIVSTSGSSALSSIGITKNQDGSLALDVNQLKSSLDSNTDFTSKTLNSLTIRSDVSTKMAQNTPKSTLLKEFNSNLVSSTGISSDDDASYTEFLSLAKNQLSLRNYYYGLSSAGIFMDISL